jgi:metal-responsive CopG/Arc/MetJ family transcriptional regulator
VQPAGIAGLAMTRSPTIGIRFTSEDLELLDLLAEKEERNRSDIVRRAIRAYAVSLGVTVKPKRKATVKR